MEEKVEKKAIASAMMRHKMPGTRHLTLTQIIGKGWGFRFFVP